MNRLKNRLLNKTTVLMLTVLFTLFLLIQYFWNLNLTLSYFITALFGILPFYYQFHLERNEKSKLYLPMTILFFLIIFTLLFNPRILELQVFFQIASRSIALLLWEDTFGLYLHALRFKRF